MKATTVVICGARRTPIGALNGALSRFTSAALGAIAISELLRDVQVDTATINEVIMGQVLTAGAGMNPARQSARVAGLADSTTAFTVNQVCGSGLRAVALGYQQIVCGDAQVVVAGGQESMSQAPHLAYVRTGHKPGDLQLTDSLLRDGLIDAFYGYPMGMTAENVAQRYKFDREMQDAYALQSQHKAATASRCGVFDKELATVMIPNGKDSEAPCRDEYIRFEATMAGMAKLKPVFRQDGSVTAANASGINDGAAALLLMSEAASQANACTPLARIVAWATAGVDPAFMGLGPVPAVRAALHKANWHIEDVDVWEINEAFAAQALAVQSELGMDPARVNVNGGAIALGHPIGASGARILVTLVHELARRNRRRGVATLCIGGGMGIALCIER